MRAVSFATIAILSHPTGAAAVLSRGGSGTAEARDQLQKALNGAGFRSIQSILAGFGSFPLAVNIN